MVFPKISKQFLAMFFTVVFASQTTVGMNLSHEDKRDQQEQTSSSSNNQDQREVSKLEKKLEKKFSEGKEKFLKEHKKGFEKKPELKKELEEVARTIAPDLEALKNVDIKDPEKKKNFIREKVSSILTTAKKAFEIGGYVAFNWFIYCLLGQYFLIFAHECGHAIADILLLGGFKAFFIGSEESPKLIDFTPSNSSFLGKLGVGRIALSKFYPIQIKGVVYRLDGAPDPGLLKNAVIKYAGFFGGFPAWLFLFFLNVGRNLKKMISPFSSLVEDETLCGYQFITKLVVSLLYLILLVNEISNSLLPLGSDGAFLIHALFGLKVLVCFTCFAALVQKFILLILCFKFIACLIRGLLQRNIIGETGVCPELVEFSEVVEFLEEWLLNFGKGGAWSAVKNVGSAVASQMGNAVGSVVNSVENKIGCRPISTVASTIGNAASSVKNTVINVKNMFERASGIASVVFHRKQKLAAQKA